MTRYSTTRYSIDPRRARRARGDLAEAWDHLVSAAERGAKQVRKSSRYPGGQARERAALAALALRGYQPPSRWRWLATGMIAGMAIGAGTAVVLARRRALPGRDISAEELAREGRAAAETARERAGGAAAQAAETVREAAGRARERFTEQQRTSAP